MNDEERSVVEREERDRCSKFARDVAAKIREGVLDFTRGQPDNFTPADVCASTAYYISGGIELQGFRHPSAEDTVTISAKIAKKLYSSLVQQADFEHVSVPGKIDHILNLYLNFNTRPIHGISVEELDAELGSIREAGWYWVRVKGSAMPWWRAVEFLPPHHGFSRGCWSEHWIHNYTQEQIEVGGRLKEPEKK